MPYFSYACREGIPYGSQFYALNHVFLLRVDSSGSYVNIHIGDWISPNVTDLLEVFGGLITNADQGVVLIWQPLGGDAQMAVTTGTSVNLMSGPQIPNQSGFEPVLQAQDGSFVGYATFNGSSTRSMVAFDQSGNIRWVVPGEQPQIATADGGVIGQSGITYDQNGNATGLIPNLPTYSWIGNAYLDGPVNQVFVNLPVFAASFTSVIFANESRNKTASMDFPPLTSCTDEGGNCSGGLGPGDLLWNAKNDLVNQLASDPVCSNVAQNSVFGKLQNGGFLGLFSSPFATSEFITYLKQTKTFYNGPLSTLDYKTAKCGESGWDNPFCSGTYPPQTVKQQFGPDVTAITVRPSKPFQSFWQPNYTPPSPNDTNADGFGVGINPSNYGVNIYNESLLFHEALHGLTDYDDYGLQDALLGLGHRSDDTTNISIYIKNNVLSNCPSFR